VKYEFKSIEVTTFSGRVYEDLTRLSAEGWEIKGVLARRFNGNDDLNFILLQRPVDKS
jgi:hypothetical protein